MGKLNTWDIIYFILIVLSLPAMALTVIGGIGWLVFTGTIPTFLWISFIFWLIFIIYNLISAHLMEKELKKTSER